ncbi:MAG: sulfatase [Zavarzinella sp.]
MRHIILLAFFFQSILAIPAADLPEKPNIVVFLSDDHGQLDSTPYGAKDVRTPEMQALADAGCVMTNAFVASPSCAPSRAALLTGLMPARNGAEANHSFKKDDVGSLPEVLRKAGYETAAFGKVAHNVMDARRHGFDQINKLHDVSAVADFLATRTSKKPLALFVGTPQPHVPWAKKSAYDPRKITLPPTSIDTALTREFRTRYYADISIADRELGETRQLVKKYLGDACLFLYTSDHGAQWPFGKWNLYDAGIRVPLILEWPGVIKAGTRSDAIVQWTDLLPTLIEVAGGKVPDKLDGQSFLQVILGKKSTHRDRIFATHSGDGDMNVTPMRCLRKDGYKYILNLYPQHEYSTHIDRGPVPDRDGVPYWESWVTKAEHDPAAATIVQRYRRRPAEELYDLKQDPHEMNNLAGVAEYTKHLQTMRQELNEWMISQNDSKKFFGKPRLFK